VNIASATRKDHLKTGSK